MTEIAFHSGVADKLAFACRLLRKSQRANARVVVTAEPEALSKLDKMLWLFDELSFVPHLYARAAIPVPEALQRTPIWLVDAGVEAPHHDVLLNLGHEPARDCERYTRLIEVVSSEASDRDAARRRWRHYESRGYSITHHKVNPHDH